MPPKLRPRRPPPVAPSPEEERRAISSILAGAGRNQRADEETSEGEEDDDSLEEEVVEDEEYVPPASARRETTTKRAVVAPVNRALPNPPPPTPPAADTQPPPTTPPPRRGRPSLTSLVRARLNESPLYRFLARHSNTIFILLFALTLTYASYPRDYRVAGGPLYRVLSLAILFGTSSALLAAFFAGIARRPVITMGLVSVLVISMNLWLPFLRLTYVLATLRGTEEPVSA